MVSLGRGPSLSPRELARALDVSESSVKRWIDAGRVPAKRTAGGHRRIELLPALKFMRESGRDVANPNLLGLAPALDLQDPVAVGDRIFDHLRAGRGEEIARIALALLVAGKAHPAELFDGPLRHAMAWIGDLWGSGCEGIFLEHRATQIVLRVLDQIDALFEAPSDAVVAVGGSIDGDPSLLPTRMAATVLAAEGISALNLGPDTPAPTLLEAAEHVGARLVWISMSYVTDAAGQGAAVAELARELDRRGILFVLGGRAVHRLQLPADAPVHVGRTMQDLAGRASELVRDSTS